MDKIYCELQGRWITIIFAESGWITTKTKLHRSTFLHIVLILQVLSSFSFQNVWDKDAEPRLALKPTRDISSVQKKDVRHWDWH